MPEKHGVQCLYPSLHVNAARLPDHADAVHVTRVNAAHKTLPRKESITDVLRCHQYAAHG